MIGQPNDEGIHKWIVCFIIFIVVVVAVAAAANIYIPVKIKVYWTHSAILINGVIWRTDIRCVYTDNQEHIWIYVTLW
jgi:hypothetical protein